MAAFHTTRGFEIPVIAQRRGGRRVDEDSLKEFWQVTGEVAKQHGCYVFSMRAGRGEKPWYVGKASRQSFAAECFSPHKLNIYNGILGHRVGKPRLTFVIPARSRGAWPMVAIDEVEEFLIGHAASRNANLANKRKLPSQNWSIQGVVPGTRGKPPAEASFFKRLMGIQKF
jgi:hypothetical protein